MCLTLLVHFYCHLLALSLSLIHFVCFCGAIQAPAIGFLAVHVELAIFLVLGWPLYLWFNICG